MSNLIINLQERENGQKLGQNFVSKYLERNLKHLELATGRNITTSDFSICWLSLEPIEYR
jgi:hypothetical protein